MDEQILQDIFSELFSALEPLEAQSAALLQFINAKGIASEEELKPFLEQAANASNVRWRGVRVRTAALISAALRPAEQEEKKSDTENKEAKPESATQAKTEKNSDQEKQGKQETKTKAEPEKAVKNNSDTDASQSQTDKKAPAENENQRNEKESASASTVPAKQESEPRTAA
jgi:outer membrane biosynthesis protein TonB